MKAGLAAGYHELVCDGDQGLDRSFPLGACVDFCVSDAAVVQMSRNVYASAACSLSGVTTCSTGSVCTLAGGGRCGAGRAGLLLLNCALAVRGGLWGGGGFICARTDSSRGRGRDGAGVCGS